MTLDQRKKQLKADLKAVDEEIAQISDAVADEFVNAGIQRVRLDGHTVYMACDRWPKVKGEKFALTECMKKNGLGDFVKEDFNTQSLRGVVNEWINTRLAELTPDERVGFDVNNAIPEVFREHLGVSEVYTVKSQR
jgi:hypothetical protein